MYGLPETAEFGGRKYQLNTDFRNILKIFSQLERGDLPESIRWRIAGLLFYSPELADEDYEAGLSYLAGFLQPGEVSHAKSRKMLDWQVDASAIIAGVNAAAGQEIRLLNKVHWWTFLSWFHAMPPGELSTRVSIREKLQKGKKLEPWEQEYYRQNKQAVDLKPAYTQQENEEIKRLNAILNGQLSTDNCQLKKG